MTDYTTYSLDSLKRLSEMYKKSSERTAGYVSEINAEIERRKVLTEPDYAAWEPKWQAFRQELVNVPLPGKRYKYIRALIAAHSTPLLPMAGEWLEYRLPILGVGPAGVSPKTHEIEVNDGFGRWIRLTIEPSWNCSLYRYRLRQVSA